MEGNKRSGHCGRHSPWLSTPWRVIHRGPRNGKILRFVRFHKPTRRQYCANAHKTTFGLEEVHIPFQFVAFFCRFTPFENENEQASEAGCIALRTRLNCEIQGQQNRAEAHKEVMVIRTGTLDGHWKDLPLQRWCCAEILLMLDLEGARFGGFPFFMPQSFPWRIPSPCTSLYMSAIRMVLSSRPAFLRPHGNLPSHAL